MKRPDLIELLHEHEGKWWFWDDNFEFRIGPFDKKQEAWEGLKAFVIYEFQQRPQYGSTSEARLHETAHALISAKLASGLRASSGSNSGERRSA